MKRLMLLASGLLVSGCATPLRPDPSIDPTGQWTVAAVDGEPTGGGPSFNFTIAPPEGSAQFGCNAGSGSLRIDRGWLVAGEWIITVAGCLPKERMRFERSGFHILSQPLAVERAGVDGIRLRNRIGSIALARRRGESDSE